NLLMLSRTVFLLPLNSLSLQVKVTKTGIPACSALPSVFALFFAALRETPFPINGHAPGSSRSGHV
ncbi:MAG: hypothetical protein V3T83_13555, partial [Acidobacteriota bacterium]